MNLTELHRKLIAAARATPPNDQVPYAFEKRIMACLEGVKPLDPMGLWSRALGFSAIFCVAVMVVMAVGVRWLPTPVPDSLSQDVEQTLFAAVDNNVDQ